MFGGNFSLSRLQKLLKLVITVRKTGKKTKVMTGQPFARAEEIMHVTHRFPQATLANARSK